MKKYMAFIGILFTITIITLIVLFSTNLLKEHRIVSFIYNYWIDVGDGTTSGDYYRNQMYYAKEDNSYHIFRVLNESEDAIIKRIDKSYFDKLEKIVDENSLVNWNEFDEDIQYENRECFFIQIEYEDGDKIFARGKGKLPNNYEKVKNELVELFLSTK